MRIVRRPLGGSPLVQAYLSETSGETSAAEWLYAGSPFRVESYRRKAQEFDRAGPERAKAAAALIRPVGPEADALLKEVADSAGYFVTTGQQPGLFGGPLYGLYKALSAVRLAECMGRTLGKPVMALFWIASEDHDWAEANHATVLDGANEVHRLDLGAEPGLARRSLAETPLGPAADEVVSRLANLFPPNDFHGRYVSLLQEAVRPEATLATAFAAVMTELLAGFPIGLVDAADPAVKEASRSLLQAEAEDPAASETALAETAAKIRECDCELQVPLIPGAANLLLQAEDGRDRLQRTEDGWRLRRSGRELSHRLVLDAAARDPCALSPNVLLRPVVESALFPTLAYVGGPAELAYFGQLGLLFRRHGLTMPVVVPRGSLLVVERKVDKLLDRFHLDADAARDLDGLLGRVAREGTPRDVTKAVGKWRKAVDGAAKELSAAVGRVDPTLKGAVTAARNASFGTLGTLEKKIARAVKHRNETEWSQLAKVHRNLWPGGKPQERVLGPLQYVMRYGPEFVALVHDALRIDVDDGYVDLFPPQR